jgi:hypothetical protein
MDNSDRIGESVISASAATLLGCRGPVPSSRRRRCHCFHSVEGVDADSELGGAFPLRSGQWLAEPSYDKECAKVTVED